MGCILGELIKRKPLMQGTSTMDQLKLTCAFLGDPAREELWYVTQRNAMNFMMSIQEKRPSSPIDFVEAFPGTTDHSRDLLSMMLVWDPSRRASVSQCLASGYIRDLKSREDQETVRRLEAIPSHELQFFVRTSCSNTNVA